MTGGPVLEVRNLSIALPPGGDRKEAAAQVSFRVGRGEIVCLVGESGSGKSVIAQAIMGLLPRTLPVTGGEALLEGEDTTRASPERLRQLRATRMSMVFQEPMTALNPVMSCGQQLDEVLVYHTSLPEAERRAKILAILREVMLPDPERMVASYPHQLSGGQRQRIMIAMALVLEPALLIADEPTTALDVTIQAQILELMKGLSQRLGAAMLIITHNLGVVARYADRVNVMYAGKIVEHGTAREIYADPRHPYTLGLLRSVPRLDEPKREKLAPIQGQPPDLTRLPRGCAFAPRCAYSITRCATEIPPLDAVDGSHLSACWVARDLRERAAADAKAAA